MKTDASANRDVLRFERVSVRYGSLRFGSVVALDDLSLRVGAGERVALIGPSGGGKTSLLGVASGLVRVSDGRVETLGVDRGSADERARRRVARRIGIVGQDLALVPSLKVVHAVNGGRLGSWSRRRAIRSLVRPFEVERVRTVLAALRLDDRMSARTGDLSGGQQQRVAVARALIQEPDLLLADEPTSSVDPELADVVMAELCSQVGNRTVIASVHDPALAVRHLDRVIGIDAGRIVFDRASSELDQAEIDQLYERQASGIAPNGALNEDG